MCVYLIHLSQFIISLNKIMKVLKKVSFILINLLVSCFIVSAQVNKGTIKGTITSQNGYPVEGVSIKILELKKTTVTSVTGNYQFNNIPFGKYTLQISFVAIAPQNELFSLDSTFKIANLSLLQTSTQLQEVRVTAQQTINEQPVNIAKTGIKPLDLPQSISIINNETITNQQVNRLSDAIKNVNGVALGTARGSTSESFYARGYVVGNNNILRNGSRVNSAVIPEASTLESVEVLKGSAALLYGGATSGAVINMVTKKPQFNYGGEVSLRAGSYALYKPIADVYGPISKNVAFRLVGTYENAESFRNTVSSNRIYINPSLLYNIGKKTSLLLQGDYLKNNIDPDFGIGTLSDTIIPTNISRNSFFNTPWAYNKVNQTTATAEVNHNFNDKWKLNFIGSYQNYDRDYFSTERIRASAVGNWTRDITRTNTEEDFFTSQINLNGKFNTGKFSHNLLVGTDAEKYALITDGFEGNFTKYDTINIVNPAISSPRTDMPASTLISQTKAPIYRFGYYLQDLISLSSKFKVLAGLRWSFQRAVHTQVNSLKTNTESRGATKTKEDKAFSPRLGLVYQPTKTTSLFASYANSFEINLGRDVFDNTLAPSIIDQFELGIKNDILRGKLSANFTIYKIINNNLAQQAEFRADGKTLNADTQVKEFVGQTTSDGFEIDLTGKIFKDLNFLAGYSYTFMRYTGNNGSFNNGEQLVRNVPHTANGTLFYTFSANKLKGLKLGASAFYTGNRYAGYNNRIGQTQAYNRIIPVEQFTTFDVSAGYQFKKFSVLAKISNLTDVLNYNVHENYSVNPIAPRQLATTISYKF